ncbi:PspC domain-containing protein [Haloechinothrix sp. LS1_15]|uniref:PspC domain-containing protein n=1 Tax=Haloechinothrix sp. LS1_15 TaxID=2652248 RepID=UPI0029440C6E|nr:PspC domain-containing protein [Haloechinothrix sp. LS1_15]MDV6014408.1 PspC domain-containing protein [Haloechinothrix sp. LS1_15]
MTDNYFNPENLKKLRRSKTNRMIAGVCGGVADYFGIEAILVRIVLVATALISLGLPVVLYAAGWLLIPEEETV